MNKTTLLFVLLAALVCAVSANTAGFAVTSSAVQCKRTVDPTLSTTSVTFTSKTACDASVSADNTSTNKTSSLSLSTYSSLSFLASVAKFPLLKMTTTAAVDVTVLGIKFSLTFSLGAGAGFPSIFEYLDNNGVAGYQPNTNDTILNTYSLQGLAWTFNVARTNITTDTAVFQVTGTATVGNSFKVIYTGYLTTNEVQLTLSNVVSRAGVNQILTPSSYKSSLEFQALPYTNTNGRYALTALVAYRGSLAKKAASRATTTNERPDTATSDQSVLTFDGDVSSQLSTLLAKVSSFNFPKPFFSFQNFVSKYATGSSTVASSPVVISSYETVTSSTNATVTEMKSGIAGAAVSRFYVSLTEKVDNFVWDPAVGAGDANNIVVSAAPTVYGSATALMIVMLLISFLL